MVAISPNDISKCIFMNEKFYISIRISLKFVPKGTIDNKIALVQVMAWRRTGDKPLSETMLTQFGGGGGLNKKLTLWRLNKMITIMQTALHNIYIYIYISRNENIIFHLNLHWYLFLMVRPVLN